MQGMDRKPFERTFASLKAEFDKWKPTFLELSKYIDPERGFFDGQTPNDPKGIDYKVLLNSTPTKAAQILAAGMRGGLTSPALPWIKLGVSDPELSEFEAVRMYLDRVQQILLTIFAKSNFYDIIYSVYEELGVFNTAAAIIEEDMRTVIRGRCFTVGEYFLGTGPDGRVNQFARILNMNALQMVREFGEENVNSDVKRAYERNDLKTSFRVHHLIEENDDRIPNKKGFMNMPYRSIYWQPESKDNTYLRIGGYEEFPIIAPRWNVIANDVYGKNGPGRLALGDSKELQEAERQYMEAQDKVVNPPVQKPATLHSQIVNHLPGGVTTYGDTADQTIKPLYQINPQLEAALARVQQLENRIKEAFFTDLFLMLQSTADDPRKTATEIIELKQEKMQILGPVLERLFTEALNPAIERTFNIANRAGILPEPPEEIQGMDMKVELISILAQAQKAAGITTIQQTATYVASLAPIFPEIVDKFDADESVDQIANMNGTPPKVVRSDEDVVKIRQQRQQQQATMAQMEAVGAAAQSAKVLSETDLGNDNALTALLGGGG